VRRRRLPTSDELVADRPGGQQVRRSSMVVGRADDPLERDADRVADGVVEALRSTDGAPSERVQPKASADRLRRSAGPATRAPIGPEGGEVDAETSAAINRRRGGGSPLPDALRSQIESTARADLSGVRVHTGAEATQLNEALGAQAFTHRNDIFMHGNAPRPESDAGRHLLAHEAAHTVQQGDSAQRSVHRKLMSKDTFNEITYEGKFTQSSKAQKAIRKLLDSYHADFPWEKQLAMSPSKAEQAVERLEEMRDVARRWINDHTLTDPDDGSKTQDPRRMKRRGGMTEFISACENEMLTMRDLTEYRSSGDVVGADHDISNIEITNPSDDYTKVKEKYEGDATSGFRRLGFLIDSSVPLDGDKAGIKMEITIPIPPGFITIELGTTSERDGGHVKAGVTVGVSGGASVGNVAKLSAGIGCYLDAKAKTGADVCELMSYALFRRCEPSSPAWPWSLGVENRIFEDDPGAEVSTGVYGKVGANLTIEKDLASMGLEIKGTSGDTINKGSIERSKGSTGARNKTSGGGLVKQGGGSRGTTQASLATQKLGLELALSGAFGILSGSVKESLGWSKKRVNSDGELEYEWDKFEISGTIAGKMPMNKTAGDKIVSAIPKYVATINKLIRAGVQSAKQETKARTGGAIVEDVGSWAAMVSELASVPKKTWQPFTASPKTAGTSIGSTADIELGVSFNFAENELVVELRLGQASALAKAIEKSGEVLQVFKVDISRSSRLLKLSHKGGKWQVS
jgi:hypothetical protein